MDRSIAAKCFLLVGAMTALSAMGCGLNKRTGASEGRDAAGSGAVWTGAAGTDIGWTSVAGTNGGVAGAARTGAAGTGVAGADAGGIGSSAGLHDSFPLSGGHQNVPCESCHGPRTSSGAFQTPKPSTACNSCHTRPANHIAVPAGQDCSACHNTNGWVPATISGGAGSGGSGGGCTACHGDPIRPNTALNPYLNSAPPRDTRGNTTTSERGVGAHQAHLTGTTLHASPLECAMCHPTPSGAHPDGSVQLSWGSLATADGAKPVWNGSSCTNYCHGVTLRGGSNTNPSWTNGPSQAACGSCHGNPPRTSTHGDHSSMPCSDCHKDANAAGTALTDKSLHINGVIDSVACEVCHPDGTGD